MDLPSTGSHLLGVSFITNLKSNLRTALTTQNTTQNNCVISHAQNTTALQSHVFSKLVYIGCWSHSKHNRISPARTNVKVNCKFLSRCLYVCIYVCQYPKYRQSLYTALSAESKDHVTFAPLHYVCVCTYGCL